MYITVTTSKGKNKTYHSVLLRESYREGGKVKNRTIANLSHCKPKEIEAIRLALQHKDDLAALKAVKTDVQIKEGQSIGALWTVYSLAKRLGIEKALGYSRQGKLALWQVLARTLDQGSRLSAVRAAGFHAAVDVLGIDRTFDEDDLYRNLGWLSDNQIKIEDRLFTARHGDQTPDLFLYDVTSSYLEGDQNALADWGYCRDKKLGKKQIVIGLLCDSLGEPVCTEVFTGNTPDLETFESQVRKVADRFGCRRVTFVGDRGMIKSKQIADLGREKFNYITAITKPQIKSLIKRGVFQLGLFDEQLCEVEDNGVRYVLRRNPVRAAELASSREKKMLTIRTMAARLNQYLADHPKADEYKAWKKVAEKRDRLMLGNYVKVTSEDRIIQVEVDRDYLAEVEELDGCYALKTDLPAEAASLETVHDRYKDLALVEQDFRTCKTDFLEIRPVHVRTARSTRGHVLVVMLSLIIIRELRRCWPDTNLTVKEGLRRLSTLCSMTVSLSNSGPEMHKIPAPRPESAELMEKAGVKLPETLPHRGIRVVTRKKLQSRRKSK